MITTSAVSRSLCSVDVSTLNMTSFGEDLSFVCVKQKSFGFTSSKTQRCSSFPARSGSESIRRRNRILLWSCLKGQPTQITEKKQKFSLHEDKFGVIFPGFNISLKDFSPHAPKYNALKITFFSRCI